MPDSRSETSFDLEHRVGGFRRNDPFDPSKDRHALASPARLIDDPESLPAAFEVTVIGDIRVDVRAAVLDHRFVEMAVDEQTVAPVVTDVGGTAIGFARAAASHFTNVHVLGVMGRDSWSDFIRGRCTTGRIDAYLTEVAGPNSMVVVLRDQGTKDNPRGVRLIVSSGVTPYGQLDADRIRSQAALIQRSDALVIDGYALLEETSAQAVDVAVDIAVEAGVPVCFDIVPHRIDRHLSFDELRPFIRRSSMISTEAHTVLRLLDRPVPTVITPDFVHAMINQLPPDVAGLRRTWLVRYGDGNMDEVSAISQGHHRVDYHTGYAQTLEVAGFGYAVAAAELKWWLTNYARAAVAYPDLAERGELVAARRFRP